MARLVAMSDLARELDPDQLSLLSKMPSLEVLNLR